MSQILTLTKYGLRAQLPLYHDHQFSGMFGECERMAYYEHILGRRTKGSTVALDWGTAFHKITEIWETTANVQDIYEFVNEFLDENLDDHYGRTRQRMFEAFMKWVEYSAANPIKTLRTEQPTIIRCDKPCIYYPDRPQGCDLQYGGIMDRIVEWQGMVGPKDYKTTVMNESDPASQYRLSHQMRGYDWIASHLMGQHCWGVIIERIITNKSSIKIDRFPVSYSKDNVRDWVENEKSIQKRIKDKFATDAWNEDAWQQNFGRCFEPYRCRWRDVCLSPKEFDFRYKWLRDNTTEKRWNFMARDKANENTDR